MRWLTTGRIQAFLLFLVLVAGAGNLAATRLEIDHNNAVQRQDQAGQQRQGDEAERKICTTMHKLAALRPPPGNPGANPSRAFEDELHATLDELGPDLGCNREG